MSRPVKNKANQAIHRGEVESQTEPIERCERWTQIPGSGSGGGTTSGGSGRHGFRSVDPLRLAQFTLKAERLINSLLLTKSFNSTSPKKMQKKSSDSKESSPVTQLTCPSIARDVPVSHLEVGPNRSFLAVQNMERVPGCAEKSIISIFTISTTTKETTNPSLILVARSHVTCITWLGGSHPGAICAGLIDGTIALWNTTEVDHPTSYKIVDNHKLIIPSYFTAGVSSKGHLACSGIVDLKSSGSGRIAATDEDGLITVLQTVSKTNNAVNDDLQQSPNSTIKLQIVKIIETKQEAVTSVGLLDPVLIFLGCESGHVLSYSQTSSGQDQDHDGLVMKYPPCHEYSRVKSLLVDSSNGQLIVGYSDSTVAIFTISQPDPVRVISGKFFTLTKLVLLDSDQHRFTAVVEAAKCVTLGQAEFRDEESVCMNVASAGPQRYHLIAAHPKGKIVIKEIHS